MIPRIYADANDLTEDGRFMLHISGSLAHIQRYGAALQPGTRVLFNVQDEFEGLLEFDAVRDMWLGRADWGTRRDL